MKIKLSIDTHNQVLTYEQKGQVNFNNVRNNIKNNWNEFDLNEAVELITNGHSWSPTHFIGGLGADAFTEAHTIGLDIDDIKAPKPKEAIALICRWFNASPAVVYNTLGSNSFNNKYRIILNCSKPISDKDVFISILTAFSKSLKTDSMCVDAARIFYGTTPDKLISSSNSIVNTDILIEFGRQYYKPPKQRLKKGKQTTSNELQWIKELDADTRIQVTILIKRLYERLATIYYQSGYETIFRSVNLFAVDLPVELSEEQFLDVVLTVFDKAVKTNSEWYNSKHVSNPEPIIVKAFEYAEKY